MRSWLVLFITLSLMVLFDLWGQSELYTLAEEGTALVSAEKTLVETGAWEKSLEGLEELLAHVETNSRRLRILVEHSKIEAMEEELAILPDLLTHRKSAEALHCLTRLALAYQDLYDSVRISWENII